MEKQVIQSVGFRNIFDEQGAPVGFQLKIRLPYYRGVYLSQIMQRNVVVDGQVYKKEQVIWSINGEDYTAEEMASDWNTHWHPLEPATLIVKKDGGLSQGFHDVEYGFCCSHSYFPPELEAAADPTKPELIFFPEFGHNINRRRMLIV